MSEVYLAEEVGIIDRPRRVALKVLPFKSSIVNPRLVELFKNEALAAASVKHPNLATVYAAGEDDGQYYIASEYIEGGDLNERLASGPMSWRDAVRIAIQIGEALQAVHCAGIVHRDVKPSNILIGTDGAVKLTDFGVAKLLHRSRAKEASKAEIVGTLLYMAPEQRSGCRRDACGSDIWGLAAVLHKMVLGWPPSSIELLLKSQQPPALKSVLRRALESEPDARYATMGDFVEALRRVSRLRFPDWLLTWGPFWYTIADAAAVVIVWYLVASPAPRLGLFPTCRMEKLNTPGDNAASVVLSPDGKQVLYTTTESGRQNVRLRNIETGSDVERFPRSDLEYEYLTFAPDGEYFYYTLDEHKDSRTVYRAPVLQGLPRKMIEDVDSAVDFSPRADYLSFFRQDTRENTTTLYVARPDGTGLRKVLVRSLDAPFAPLGSSWSPDGKKIITAVYDEHGAVPVEINVASGRIRRLVSHHWGWIGRISWARTGDVLIFPATEPGSNSTRIYQLSYTKKIWNVITTELADYPDAHGAGGRIASVMRDRLSGIWIISIQDPARARRVTSSFRRYFGVLFSPDGSLLTIDHGDDAHIWRVSQDGAAQQLTEGHYVDWGTAESPDGKQLVFVSNRGGRGWSLWTVNSDGRFPHQLSDGEGDYSSPSFTPDGWVVYSCVTSGQSSIWRIRAIGGRPELLLSGADFPIVSPDGRLLACAYNPLDSVESRWQTSVIDLRTRAVIRRFGKIPPDSWIRWTPDGTRLSYIVTRNGVSNIWTTSVVTGLETQVTRFGENQVFSFDWSKDGRDLACVRGSSVMDLVLFRCEQ